MSHQPPLPSGRVESPTLRSDEFAHLPSYLGATVEDLWEAWRLAQHDVDVAFEEWLTGPDASLGRDRFTVYLAALDREQQAAAIVAEATARPVRRRRRDRRR